MHQENPRHWISVRLFFHGPAEIFLAKAVKPFAMASVQTGLADCYYIERYPEAPQMLVLNIAGSKPLIDSILLPNLSEHFSQYQSSYPASPFEEQVSQQSDDPQSATLSSEVIPYHSPQLGEHAYHFLPVIEDGLVAISDAILKLLKSQLSQWYPEAAPQWAFRMASLALTHLGFDAKELAAFLKWLSDAKECGDEESNRRESVKMQAMFDLDKNQTAQKSIPEEKEHRNGNGTGAQHQSNWSVKFEKYWTELLAAIDTCDAGNHLVLVSGESIREVDSKHFTYWPLVSLLLCNIFSQWGLTQTEDKLLIRGLQHRFEQAPVYIS